MYVLFLTIVLLYGVPKTVHSVTVSKTRQYNISWVFIFTGLAAINGEMGWLPCKYRHVTTYFVSTTYFVLPDLFCINF